MIEQRKPLTIRWPSAGPGPWAGPSGRHPKRRASSNGVLAYSAVDHHDATHRYAMKGAPWLRESLTVDHRDPTHRSAIDGVSCSRGLILAGVILLAGAMLHQPKRPQLVQFRIAIGRRTIKRSFLLDNVRQNTVQLN